MVPYHATSSEFHTNFLQNFLDGYVESVDSTYGCVLLRGRVVAATKNWLSLHPDEVNLLSLVVTTDAWATLKVRLAEVHVSYLPLKRLSTGLGIWAKENLSQVARIFHGGKRQQKQNSTNHSSPTL